MSRKAKQRIVIIGAVLLFILIILSVHQKTSSTDKGTGENLQPTEPTISITRAGLDDGLDATGLDAVEDAVPTYIERYSPESKGNFSATIRSGTLVNSFRPYSGAEATRGKPLRIPVQQYIIDIPSVKQSYAITRAGGNYYPYNNVYVRCVSKDQLKFGDFGCIDGDQ